MKNNRIFLVWLLLTSCGDLVVRFEAPQPEGKSRERAIPKNIVGEYSSLDDSSKLSITRDLIIKYSVINSITKLDSADRREIKNDTAYSGVNGSVAFSVIVKGDSARQRWTYYDTIFNESKGDVLKKYKGYYFLNKQVSNNSWHVTTLSRIENGIILGSISTLEEIENLREITGVKSDTIVSFRPTRKQMKRFLTEKGFSGRDTFIRIN